MHYSSHILSLLLLMLLLPSNLCCSIILQLPDEIIAKLFSEFFPPTHLPAFMFSCKALFRICAEKRQFQRYLAWRYGIEELEAIAWHPQLLRLEENVNYFAFDASVVRQLDWWHFERLVQLSPVKESAGMEEVLLVLLDLKRKGRED